MATTAAPTPSTADPPPRWPARNLSSFVGRDRDLSEIGAWLRGGARLVTLLGPGGVGKTRLALTVAAARLADGAAYPDGVVFVDLGPVVDPALVPEVVAKALAIAEGPGQAGDAAVLAHVRPRTLLLVLDNCEHLLAAATSFSIWLEAAPGLSILATSRRPLNLRGERRYQVAPLGLPADDRPEAVAASPAGRLFVERARASLPNFVLDAGNAGAVAGICRRLDGLPLALELAAVRVPLLGVKALLARLDQALPILTAGPRDAPARLRTLGAAIAWSHDLLGPAEQAAFRRLSVFAAGFDLEAVEAVIGPALELEIVDVFAGLVDSSLVQPREDPHGRPRFALLETVRQFAGEQLSAVGEEAGVRDAHADYYLGLAERASRHAEQIALLDALEADHENLRAALTWLLSGSPARDAERGLRLATSLLEFWTRRGYLRERKIWLERALSSAEGIDSELRAQALLSLANTAYDLEENARALDLFRAALELCRRLGYAPGVKIALGGLGYAAHNRGDLDEARARLKESLSLHQDQADAFNRAVLLYSLGNVASDVGDVAEAESSYQAAMNIWEAMEDANDLGFCCLGLGRLARRTGRPDDARRWLDQGLPLMQAAGDERGVANIVDELGRLAQDAGDLSAAAPHLSAALFIRQRLGDVRGIVESLESVARRAVLAGRFAGAIRLRETAMAWRQTVGTPLAPIDQEVFDRDEDAARTALDAAVFADSLAHGRHRSVNEAIPEALALLDDPELKSLPPREVGTALPFGLSRREVEVLRLITEGRTDQEIGDALFIARRTVTTHVSHILTKLDVTSRTAAAAVAVQIGLA